MAADVKRPNPEPANASATAWFNAEPSGEDRTVNTKGEGERSENHFTDYLQGL